MELSASRTRFARDDFPHRVGAIAANLARIKSFVQNGVDGLMIRSLMRESEIFIEEVARVSTIDEAVQLLALQRQLALWLRRDGRFPAEEDRTSVARFAADWSRRLLEMSGMLGGRAAGDSAVPLVVPHRHKFGLMAFPGVWCGFDTVISHGFVVSSRPPIHLSEFWVRRLGEEYAEAFRDAGAYLLKTEASNRPEILDDENNRLVRDTETARLALAIASAGFRTGKAIGATGGNPDGEVDVRSTGPYAAIRESPAGRRTQLTEADVRRAMSYVAHIECIPRESRLWKALVYFVRGLERERGDDRIHEFVRCVEGFIAPEKGKTKRQFVSRVGFVVEDLSTTVLSEIFEIRSAVEHLWDPKNKIGSDDPDGTFVRRVDEAEAIARCFIQRVLETPALLRDFASDEGIESFWKADERTKGLAWGSKLRASDSLSQSRYE